MTLYADMLFIINFIMNTFVLWVVSKLAPEALRRRKKLWLVLGAALMSLLYTLLIALEPLRMVNTALSSIIILAAGVLATFRIKSPRTFAKVITLSYAISFALGGLGMALFFLTGIPHAVYFIANDWQGFARAISWQLALTGMVLSYVLIKIGLFCINRQRLKKQLITTVEVFVGEQTTRFQALVDTGHSLKDPLTQTHVVIAEFAQIKDFLPSQLRLVFYENQESDLSNLIPTEADPFHKRIRMIPFTSLGRSNGMLIGFRADKIKIQDPPQEITDVTIGIYNQILCPQGKYQGLMSPAHITQTERSNTC